MSSPRRRRSSAPRMEVWSPCTTGAHRRNATRRSTRHCWANGLPAWRFSITTAVSPASSIGSALNASDARLPVIAVDAMGGDDAPGEIVAGALLAHRDKLGHIVLVGDRARIEPLLSGERDIEIVHSAGEVAMDAAASAAVRKAAGTSLGDAVELVRDGRA